MHALGQIFDNFEHRILQIRVKLTPDRQVDGAASCQGVEVHGLAGGEFLPRLMEVETNKVTDLVTFDVNNLNGVPSSDHKSSPFSCRNHYVFSLGHVPSSFWVSMVLPLFPGEV